MQPFQDSLRLESRRHVKNGFETNVVNRVSKTKHSSVSEGISFEIMRLNEMVQSLENLESQFERTKSSHRRKDERSKKSESARRSKVNNILITWSLFCYTSL